MPAAVFCINATVPSPSPSMLPNLHRIAYRPHGDAASRKGGAPKAHGVKG